MLFLVDVAFLNSKRITNFDALLRNFNGPWIKTGRRYLDGVILADEVKRGSGELKIIHNGDESR